MESPLHCTQLSLVYTKHMHCSECVGTKWWQKCGMRARQYNYTKGLHSSVIVNARSKFSLDLLIESIVVSICFKEVWSPLFLFLWSKSSEFYFLYNFIWIATIIPTCICFYRVCELYNPLLVYFFSSLRMAQQEAYTPMPIVPVAGKRT